jgi:hypothetical protein
MAKDPEYMGVTKATILPVITFFSEMVMSVAETCYLRLCERTSKTRFFGWAKSFTTLTV